MGKNNSKHTKGSTKQRKNNMRPKLHSLLRASNSYSGKGQAALSGNTVQRLQREANELPSLFRARTASASNSYSGKGQAALSGNTVQRLQREVIEVEGIMRTTVDEVIKRGEKSENLDGVSDRLMEGAGSFKLCGGKFAKQKNKKHSQISKTFISFVCGVVFSTIAAVLWATYVATKDKSILVATAVFTGVAFLTFFSSILFAFSPGSKVDNASACILDQVTSAAMPRLAK